MCSLSANFLTGVAKYKYPPELLSKLLSYIEDSCLTCLLKLSDKLFKIKCFCQLYGVDEDLYYMSALLS